MSEDERPYNMSHETQQAAAADFAGVELPERRQEDEETVDWFARSLGKPKPSDLADMVRWTNKIMVEENVHEYQMRWIDKSIDVLDKLDDILDYDSFQMKRTMLLITMADYLGKPRNHIFKRPESAGRVAFSNWMRKPELRNIFEELQNMMKDEVLAHELESVKQATTITRISAAKAAEVRLKLLDHANPWVQLQAARDILQAADRSTAAKGKENMNLNLNLSSDQVDQLLEKASAGLREWEDLAAPGTENGRPLVIIEQATEVDEEQVRKLAEGE